MEGETERERTEKREKRKKLARGGGRGEERKVEKDGANS